MNNINTDNDSVLRPEGVRVRFAVSPASGLHIGNARTALFNWLFARRYGGRFVLRIENAQEDPSTQERIDLVVSGLRWLKLDWDEGPDMGGAVGPYLQSKRMHIYKQYLEKLIDKGYAYPCFCSLEELEEKRRTAAAQGVPPRYDNKCRSIAPSDWKKMIDEDNPPCWRFKIPDNKTIVVNDLIRKDVCFESSLYGDMVIVNSDGMPSYQFASIVDDLSMGITHVIQGEDNLPNVARQILFADALGGKIPEYVHLPLVLAPDKTKLGSDCGIDVCIDMYRDKGYLPEGILNYMALLGWSGDEKTGEIMDRATMVQAFSLDELGKSASTFDQDKLDWVCAQHLRQLDESKLTAFALPYMDKAGLAVDDVSEDTFNWFTRIIGILSGYVSCFSQIPEHMKGFLVDRIDYLELSKTSKNYFFQPGIAQMLSFCREKLDSLENVTQQDLDLLQDSVREDCGFSGKRFFMSVRIAVTGREHGPELIKIIEVMGLKTVVTRLDDAVKFLTQMGF